VPDRPRVLIESWLPIAELGIESRREAAPIPGQFPKLKTLHIWWARRPLAASAGAILGSLLPAWSDELSKRFPEASEVADAKSYQAWNIRLCGILGDPVAAKLRIAVADEKGITLGAAAYGYKQAFKNSPTVHDVGLLHTILTDTWGRLPTVVDPTAGGGSIPYEALRYGLPTHANDLNPVAAAILRASLSVPVAFGPELVTDIERWGAQLIERIRERMLPYFTLPDLQSDNNSYLFARTVACPRTGKSVPLSPNWWLSTSSRRAAVRLVTERNGHELDKVEFEIVQGNDIDFDPEQGIG
jgi:adenine-specific DNA methylase